MKSICLLLLAITCAQVALCKRDYTARELHDTNYATYSNVCGPQYLIDTLENFNSQYDALHEVVSQVKDYTSGRFFQGESVTSDALAQSFESHSGVNQWFEGMSGDYAMLKDKVKEVMLAKLNEPKQLADVWNVARMMLTDDENGGEKKLRYVAFWWRYDPDTDKFDSLRVVMDKPTDPRLDLKLLTTTSSMFGEPMHHNDEEEHERYYEGNMEKLFGSRKWTKQLNDFFVKVTSNQLLDALRAKWDAGMHWKKGHGWVQRSATDTHRALQLDPVTGGLAAGAVIEVVGKFADVYGKVATNFKTTNKSEQVKTVIGKGFKNIAMKTRVFKHWIFNTKVDLFMERAPKIWGLDKDQQVLDFLETATWGPKSDYADQDMSFSKGKSNWWKQYSMVYDTTSDYAVQHVSTLLVCASTQVDNFELADDLLTESHNLSVLGGIYESTNYTVKSLPRDFTTEDMQTMSAFMKAFNMAGIAHNFGDDVVGKKLEDATK